MPFKDPEERRAYIKAYTQRNAAKTKAYLAEWWAANKEGQKVKRAPYWAANRAAFNKKKLEKYHRDMKDPVKKLHRILTGRVTVRLHRAANREACNKWARENAKHRRATDPEYALKSLLRSRTSEVIRRAGANKPCRSFELVGCSSAYLKMHLEAQFTEGMTWENRGKWEVDHIRPCSSFNLLDPEQQRCCFHYTNLQPLWQFDNRTKHAKII